MKKILTAIGNPMLNHKIKNTENYEVLSEDIKIDEELLEWIEKTQEVDILFLCSHIIRNYKIDEFIQIIRKIQEDILIIFFEGENIESSVKEDEHLKIYNSLDLDLEILEKILQKVIQKNIRKYTSKTISISGVSGVGKSTFSTFLAKSVENQSIKTLLIDFDLEESQIRTLLKIKKQPQSMETLKDMVIHINKNLDVLTHLDFIYPQDHPIDFLKIQEIFHIFKQEYNLIIIDTSSKLENEYTKRIFYNSDEIIFLLEPNILGVKKSKNMLEVLENDWKIDFSKIKLILNKANIYQISNTIIEELFPDIKLLGRMKYNDAYNLMINKNVDKKEIKREYEKMYKRIC